MTLPVGLTSWVMFPPVAEYKDTLDQKTILSMLKGVFA